MKKFVFFDLDGTLSDSRPGILAGAAYALRKLGFSVEPAEITTNFIGPPLYDSFRKYYGLSDGDAHRAVALYREYYKAGGLFENVVYPGIPDTLAALKAAGLSLYLTTGKPLCFSVPICEKFGFAPYLSGYFATELDGTRGDKPSLLAYALRELSLSPADGVMVGDRSFDMEGAAANRMPSVGVLWGYGDEEELSSAGALHLVHSPKELTELLLSL